MTTFKDNQDELKELIADLNARLITIEEQTKPELGGA